MNYDFSKLTENQKWLLTVQGWDLRTNVIRQPSKQTVRKLIERGLVVPWDVVHRGIRFTTYRVPIEVHAAWCAHCSRSLAK